MSYHQKIFNRFRQLGLSEAASLGFIGNFECESNCEPNRVQYDYSSFRTTSKDYTARVENGSISKSQFCADQKGYGLAQWTLYSRKAALYDAWKASGKHIDDVNLQVEFTVQELKQNVSGLSYNEIKDVADLYNAVSIICKKFERPAFNNVDVRFSAANRIKNEINLNEWKDGGGDEPAPKPTPTPAPTPAKDHTLTLRTIDWHCENFKEFALLKALLECRNYDTADWDNDGVWDAFEQFQKDNGLDPDRVCGKLGWNALLKR